jgi:protein-disulfide isomerase
VNKDPGDDIEKPLPQAESSAQPEARRLSETTSQDVYIPYVPLKGNGDKKQRSGLLLSRRTILALLSVLAIGVALKGYYSTPPNAILLPRSVQPVIAVQTTLGCPLLESASAEITIEEYTDFTCPYCAKFASYLEEIKRDFGSRIRIVYHNLPRPAHGPIAETAALAFTAVCLQNPSVAYSYYTDLLGHQNALFTTGEAFLYKAASKYNIDIGRMKSDMASKIVVDQVEQDKVRAKQSGLILSPSWVIGKQNINGTYDYPRMKQFIESQLNHK